MFRCKVFGADEESKSGFVYPVAIAGSYRYGFDIVVSKNHCKINGVFTVPIAGSYRYGLIPSFQKSIE